MAEFEQTISIEAPSDEVFAFVSNLNNIPKYLPARPTTGPQSSDRMRGSGDYAGKFFDADGWLRIDPAEYMVEWSADTDRHYSGWLEIEDHNDRCDLTVHLSFRPRTAAMPLPAEDAGRFESVVDNGLKTTLQSIKRIVEGSSVGMKVGARG